MAAALGATIPFAGRMPGGLIPAAFADTDEAFTIAGKEGLRILNDRPINAETPPHLLDDDFTPAKHFFVRNNGIPPAPDVIGAADEWVLEIAGESCITPKRFTLAQLKKTFKHHTYALTLECGGNGRNEFDPPAKGNQWSTGAVGCAKMDWGQSAGRTECLRDRPGREIYWLLWSRYTPVWRSRKTEYLQRCSNAQSTGRRKLAGLAIQW